jgi:hypothetical protein
MTYSSCVRNCVDENYSFAINNSFYPDKDTISIGDTIWMEVDAPTTNMDLMRQQPVDYSGAANLGTAISFLKLLPGSIEMSNAIESAHDFKLVLVEGRQVDNPFVNKVREFLFTERDAHYHFKLGMIPTSSGDFIIDASNSAGTYRKQNKCTKAGFEITISNTDQHLYIYQNARPGYEISGYEQTHIYCFHVR